MEDVQGELRIPIKNQHYIDCVWSNPDCNCGPDTCKRTEFPNKEMQLCKQNL